LNDFCNFVLVETGWIHYSLLT